MAGSKAASAKFNGVYDETERPVAGYQTVAVDAVDSMALHMGFVGLTMLFGYACKEVLLLIEARSAWLTEYKFFTAFPLFPFSMFGGILLQLLMDKFARPSLLDRGTCDRISGLALEFTILTAVVVCS